jgi:hypothetical protein
MDKNQLTAEQQALLKTLDSKIEAAQAKGTIKEIQVGSDLWHILRPAPPTFVDDGSGGELPIPEGAPVGDYNGLKVAQYPLVPNDFISIVLE